MKLVIVVPAFNESSVIYQVLTSLPKRLEGITNIETIVVDDGSSDKTSREAKKAGAKVLRHISNRGVGAATKTGIEYAKIKEADVVVTFDADGQHDPEDIPKLLKPIISRTADVVIGSRFKKKQKMPLDRFFLNWFANLITFILFGVVSTDSQSGLRAFSKKAINLINFSGERMDFSSEILLEAKKHKLKTHEVPIKAIYTSYSRAKGQKNINSISILVRFIIKFLR